IVFINENGRMYPPPPPPGHDARPDPLPQALPLRMETTFEIDAGLPNVTTVQREICVPDYQGGAVTVYTFLKIKNPNNGKLYSLKMSTNSNDGALNNISFRTGFSDIAGQPGYDGKDLFFCFVQTIDDYDVCNPPSNGIIICGCEYTANHLTQYVQGDITVNSVLYQNVMYADYDQEIVLDCDCFTNPVSIIDPDHKELCIPPGYPGWSEDGSVINNKVITKYILRNNSQDRTFGSGWKVVLVNEDGFSESNSLPTPPWITREAAFFNVPQQKTDPCAPELTIGIEVGSCLSCCPGGTTQYDVHQFNALPVDPPTTNDFQVCFECPEPQDEIDGYLIEMEITWSLDCNWAKTHSDQIKGPTDPANDLRNLKQIAWPRVELVSTDPGCLKNNAPALIGRIGDGFVLDDNVATDCKTTHTFKFVPIWGFDEVQVTKIITTNDGFGGANVEVFAAHNYAGGDKIQLFGSEWIHEIRRQTNIWVGGTHYITSTTANSFFINIPSVNNPTFTTVVITNPPVGQNELLAIRSYDCCKATFGVNINRSTWQGTFPTDPNPYSLHRCQDGPLSPVYPRGFLDDFDVMTELCGFFQVPGNSYQTIDGAWHLIRTKAFLEFGNDYEIVWHDCKCEELDPGDTAGSNEVWWPDYLHRKGYCVKIDVEGTVKNIDTIKAGVWNDLLGKIFVLDRWPEEKWIEKPGVTGKWHRNVVPQCDDEELTFHLTFSHCECDLPQASLDTEGRCRYGNGVATQFWTTFEPLACSCHKVTRRSAPTPHTDYKVTVSPLTECCCGRTRCGDPPWGLCPPPSDPDHDFYKYGDPYYIYINSDPSRLPEIYAYAGDPGIIMTRPGEAGAIPDEIYPIPMDCGDVIESIHFSYCIDKNRTAITWFKVVNVCDKTQVISVVQTAFQDTDEFELQPGEEYASFLLDEVPEDITCTP
ncbi:MAG: hypothetical protein DRH24_19290, partial [Deltaproteobacteria bacterium]